MKKLVLVTVALLAGLSAHAGGFCYSYRPCGSSFSFSVGFPFYGGGCYRPYAYYAPPVYSYPAYAYPSYSGYDYGYGYSRPNYAVGGTLLGAGIGAIVGNNVHHQTWQGAAIGAGAGLLLGGLAEHRARVQERSYATPVIVPQAYAQPNVIADAPTVPDAPRVPDPIAAQPVRAAGTMNGANSLFGR